jgi:probable rRNA maturation factor
MPPWRNSTGRGAARRSRQTCCRFLPLPVQGAPGATARPAALGDIVLAAGVVSAEASAQGKPLANHATHLIVHGVLHLLGFDHVDEAHAEAMERLETEVMSRLGLPDPYEDAQAPGRLQARPALLDER